MISIINEVWDPQYFEDVLLYILIPSNNLVCGELDEFYTT